MSRTRKVVTAPFRGVKQLSQMVFSRSAGLVWRFMPRSRFNYEAEVGDGLSSSLIMAPILWMARTFPEAPPQVLDADGAPIEHHAMVKLLRRPNRFYSGIVMWMASILSWVVDGNAYWIKIRNGVGGVAELWYVPHWMITPQGDASALITHYEYRPDGQLVRLEVEDVVHFRYGLDPHNTRKGLSPLGSVLREVFTDDEAAAFSAALLRNLGVPGLIVSPEGDHSPGPDDVKATKDYVDEEFSGDKRGKPMVMSGPTKVHQFGFSPEQLTLKDLRRVPEERVTAVLGLPAIVVGLGAGLERSTFANYSEAREAAYEENVIPSQRMFGEELRHQLLPDFEDRPDELEVDFDRSKVRVLQEDRVKEAQRLGSLYKDGLITRKEGREYLGKETDDADDVYSVPLGVLLTPSGREPEPAEDEEAEPKRRGLKATRAQNRLILAFERERRQLEAVLAEELEADFDSLGELAEQAFLDNVPDEGLSARSNGNRKASDESTAQSVLSALAIGDWAQKHIGARLQVHYRRTADRTVETLNAVMDLGVELPDEVAQQIIDAGGTRLGLIDVAGDTRKAITRAIAAGREAGQGPIDIARAIRSEVPAGRFTNAGPAYRAQLIARSETLHAQGLSSLTAYREAETVTAVIAFDARLGDSDEDCMARDGQQFSFDEAEVELAQEHPNGTLSFAPVVGTPEPIGAA